MNVIQAQMPEPDENDSLKSRLLPFGPRFRSLGLPQAILAECYAEMQRLIDQLNLSDEERESLVPLFKTEFERQLPQIIMKVGLSALLPLLGKRARMHFLAKGQSDMSSEDLAQKVSLNIVKALGRCPRGNIGAWVAAIRKNVYLDRIRETEREKKILDRAKDERRSLESNAVRRAADNQPFFSEGESMESLEQKLRDLGVDPARVETKRTKISTLS